MCGIIFFEEGILKINLLGKFLIGLGITGGLLIGGCAALYLKGLPYIVSHPKFIQFTQDTVKKYIDADLLIEKPVLHTELSPNIEFKVENLYLSKDNKKLFDEYSFLDSHKKGCCFI